MEFVKFVNVTVGGALALLTAIYVAPWFFWHGPLAWWQFAVIEVVAIAIAGAIVTHIERTGGRL